MTVAHAESAFQNPYIALLVGTAVSLDVIALTFCSAHIYSSDRKTWLRWAKYNAAWHGGLLLTYLLFIDVLSVVAQYAGLLLSMQLPPWLAWIAPVWGWIADKFRSHIVVYAAIAAMAYVWHQYSRKIRAVPTRPEVREAPLFLRWTFMNRAAELSNPNSRWAWHLSACLVAVDMLALAAVIKSGEKLVQFPRGITSDNVDWAVLNRDVANSLDSEFLLATLTITLAVFLIVGIFCFAAAKISQVFWSNIAQEEGENHRVIAANFIVVALKLLEPLVIFYFIIHSMAFLATGIPLHSPAFILGSGFLVAALVQYVGFKEIVGASSQQVSQRDTNRQEPPDA